MLNKSLFNTYKSNRISTENKILRQWGNDVYYSINDAGSIGHLEETKFYFFLIEYIHKYLLNT